MKVLLTGKGGQLGFELQRSLAPIAEVVALGTQDCNLADVAVLRERIRLEAPDIIVNPAAYTAVDNAEDESELAHAVNAVAPGVLAEEAAALGALLVHYSTDYVFDGSKPVGDAYSEVDTPAPLGQYGRTKLAGEKAVSSATDKYLILRTSWVVGVHGNNFAKTMLRLAAEKDQLTVVADQWGAPTSAALLADVTAQLIKQYQQQPSDFPYGLYHLAAGGETTWHQYACYVIEQARAKGCSVKVAADGVIPIASSEYPVRALRPVNSKLSTHKLQETFGIKLPHWQAGVDQVLEQLL